MSERTNMWEHDINFVGFIKTQYEANEQSRNKTDEKKRQNSNKKNRAQKDK